MHPILNQQDITISKVCLAGWRIEGSRDINDFRNYTLFRPDGSIYGFFWTRYTAALAAEESIWADDCGALPDAAKAFGGPLPPR